MFVKSVALGLLFTLSGCAHSLLTGAQSGAQNSASACSEVRAAFDVGSATTRMQVAEVDSCAQKIVKVIANEERPVGYKEDLERSSAGEFSGEFSQALRTRGLAVFTELKSIAQASGANQFQGTATSAFRGAKNAQSYLDHVSEKAGVTIRVIAQSTEAELGFLAAMSEGQVDPATSVVWDIGGGSMQFVARENGAFVKSLVELGSVSFKNEVLKKLRPKAPLTESPNPIGRSNFKMVVALAKEHALSSTTPEMRALLTQRQVIGIGGVHAYSILKRLKDERDYTDEELETALRKRLSLSDKEIGGAYAATDVTNMALVLGYMQALKIKTVRAFNVNLTSGSLLYPEFWTRSN